MKIPRLYLGTMTYGWSQTSSKVDERVAGEMLQLFLDSAVVTADGGTAHVDTANIYADGKTERLLGAVLTDDNRKTCLVGTKAHPSKAYGLSATGIRRQLYESMDALKLEKFAEYYLHQPDPEHDLLESLECLHEHCFPGGAIQKIGMSNFHASEMKRAFHLCQKHGFDPPTVYQGLYNPLNRAIEKELLPVLRANNCSFVAYNPLAGGLLVGKYKSCQGVVPKGRFENNENYLPRYYTDVNFQAVDLIRNACDEAGITMVEATYRWLLCHSALKPEDGVLLGASSVAQLQENLAATQKALDESKKNCAPLPYSILTAFEDAWKLVEKGAFPYWRSYSQDMPDGHSLDQGASYAASKSKKK